MHEPTQKCENNAIFKHNHCLKLFIAFKMTYSWGKSRKSRFPPKKVL